MHLPSKQEENIIDMSQKIRPESKKQNLHEKLLATDPVTGEDEWEKWPLKKTGCHDPIETTAT